MKLFKGRKGFTLIELLVVILILAILMAIALPLYLRAVADSERQTCRTNMQTIATAEQAYKVRSVGHVYTADLTATSPLIVPAVAGQSVDLQAIPMCPNTTTGTSQYTAVINADNTITISCPNTSGGVTHGSYTPGS
jgi:type IV pilus assembly protein PilA